MTRRLHGLDWLRLAAVLLVVVQHSLIFVPGQAHVGRSLLFFDGTTRWNVPALFFISGFMDGQHVRAGRTTHTAARLGRLLAIYAIWGSAYASLFGFEAYLKRVPAHLPTVVEILTGQGVYFVLWFLPMLIYCTAIGSTLRTGRASAVGAVALFAGWLALVAVFPEVAVRSYAASPVGFLCHLPFFAGCYLFAKALGTAGGVARPLNSLPLLVASTASALVVSGLMSASSVRAAVTNGSALGALALAIAALAAVGLLLLALRSGAFLPELPRFWATTAPLGIYLIHMLFLQAMARTLGRSDISWCIFVPLLAVVGSLGGAASAAALVGVPVLRPAFGHPIRPGQPSEATRVESDTAA